MDNEIENKIDTYLVPAGNNILDVLSQTIEQLKTQNSNDMKVPYDIRVSSLEELLLKLALLNSKGQYDNKILRFMFDINDDKIDACIDLVISMIKSMTKTHTYDELKQLYSKDNKIIGRL